MATIVTSFSFAVRETASLGIMGAPRVTKFIITKLCKIWKFNIDIFKISIYPDIFNVLHFCFVSHTRFQQDTALFLSYWLCKLVVGSSIPRSVTQREIKESFWFIPKSSLLNCVCAFPDRNSYNLCNKHNLYSNRWHILAN